MNYLKVGCQFLDPERWMVDFADIYARSLWTRWRWILKSYQVMKGRIHLSHQYLGSLILGFSPEKSRKNILEWFWNFAPFQKFPWIQIAEYHIHKFVNFTEIVQSFEKLRLMRSSYDIFAKITWNQRIHY